MKPSILPFLASVGLAVATPALKDNNFPVVSTTANASGPMRTIQTSSPDRTTTGLADPAGEAIPALMSAVFDAVTRKSTTELERLTTSEIPFTKSHAVEKVTQKVTTSGLTSHEPIQFVPRPDWDHCWTITSPESYSSKMCVSDVIDSITTSTSESLATPTATSSVSGSTSSLSLDHASPIQTRTSSIIHPRPGHNTSRTSSRDQHMPFHGRPSLDPIPHWSPPYSVKRVTTIVTSSYKTLATPASITPKQAVDTAAGYNTALKIAKRDGMLRYPSNFSSVLCPRHILNKNNTVAPNLIFKISEVDHKVHPLAWVDEFIHVRKKLHTLLEFTIPQSWIANERQCTLWGRTPEAHGKEELYKIYNKGELGVNVMESGARINSTLHTWSAQPKAKWTLGKVSLERSGGLFMVGSFPCPNVENGRWSLRLNSEHSLDIVLPQTNLSTGNITAESGLFLTSCRLEDEF